MSKTKLRTKIVIGDEELVDSDHPFCALPSHYFEREIARRTALSSKLAMVRERRPDLLSRATFHSATNSDLDYTSE